ncbi:hypothetical protein NK6_3993 [Bradyrhizobium diazoefficiens]|uniref:Uncharacterized protein n=1 Tax=Bradyrhizobium diazoefficiens TaxID=1355477 RepID=A0A0E4BQ50_9BRAD|nr:hypothetical protein NK6_3993 [Bradyrhizobium diazoefficiens]
MGRHGRFLLDPLSSFRDAPLGAGPESITTSRGYGFRARPLRVRPGMTAGRSARAALRAWQDTIAAPRLCKTGRACHSAGRRSTPLHAPDRPRPTRTPRG